MKAQMLFSCAKKLVSLITDRLNTRKVGLKRIYPNIVTDSNKYVLWTSCPSRKTLEKYSKIEVWVHRSLWIWLHLLYTVKINMNYIGSWMPGNLSVYFIIHFTFKNPALRWSYSILWAFVSLFWWWWGFQVLWSQRMGDF